MDLGKGHDVLQSSRMDPKLLYKLSANQDNSLHQTLRNVPDDCHLEVQNIPEYIANKV